MADLTADLPRIRAEAEQLLTDACRIERRAGDTVDPATKNRVPTWSLVAESPCRVRSTGTQPRDALPGDEPLAVAGLTVSLPVALVDVRVGDRVLLSASGDASLVGVPLYVRSVQRGSQLALRRLLVSEVA